MLVPNFWISGTVTHIRELTLGWPPEWPTPPIAVPTRSGRPSGKWGRDIADVKRADATTWRPDHWGTPAEIAHLARNFDLVHVNEAETTPSSQEWWYQTLELLETPWTLQLNGNLYPTVNWDRILRSPRSTGVIWQTPGNVPEALVRDDRATLVPLSRPWNLRSATYDPPAGPGGDKPPLVGFHGRLAPDKGVAHVAALAKHLDVDVCLHGASPGGGYPYAYGLQHTYLGDRKFRAEEPWTAPDLPLHYEGPYGEGYDVSLHHTVHVSATRLGFSAGTEFALLEAIDAGCRIVVPDHMTEPATLGVLRQWTYPWEPRGLKTALSGELRSLSEAVNHALYVSSYDASHNRQVLATHHNPAALACAFFGVAASRI